MLDDDEKRVINGDRPFTKAKRSKCDMLDWNELQTYASLEKMMGQIKNKTTVIKQTKKDLLPFKGRTKLKPMDQYMECKTRSRPTRPRSMPHVAQSIPGPNLSPQLLVSKRNCQLAPRSILNLDQVIQSEVPFP
uniref:Uncharacterized protein n=1 Tax=Brassica oleracea TaxID=3712 RepID=A0A3P6G4V3_BRAOL|nr:unnamed protein product [Brassica oleracea]